MKKVAVIYWSGTGNTEEMAKAVAEGAKNDQTEVSLLSVSEATADTVKNADAIALGCPSMGAEVLEESEMEPFVASIESLVSGKSLALFGSYGWGNGEWMQDWSARMSEHGASLVAEGLIVMNNPDDSALEECKALGRKLNG
ncbi:flavodoxin|uniref:Flavodoxin n=1 Tax=Dendrosporobacter quercicolus TaxID=146817 RepID=A0A1G9QTR5_9FIRM|nr:flavodoxin [Dendrosporobacter quercicolus]NSL48356.1 flavodoxin [Dendrosporobacter quercicolus DSM 1736]SDM14261.1 flavodoxin, short chain [Dendrosporobacter quercicolus]